MVVFHSKRYPLKLQKVAFQVVKGKLLHRKRHDFIMRKAVSLTTKGEKRLYEVLILTVTPVSFNIKREGR